MRIIVLKIRKNPYKNMMFDNSLGILIVKRTGLS